MSTEPQDPFVADRFPEVLMSDEADERVEAFLHRYSEDGEMLTGWVLLTAWIPAGADQPQLAWNLSPGMDWFRILGLLRAGALKLEREYLTEEAEE